MRKRATLLILFALSSAALMGCASGAVNSSTPESESDKLSNSLQCDPDNVIDNALPDEVCELLNQELTSPTDTEADFTVVLAADQAVAFQIGAYTLLTLESAIDHGFSCTFDPMESFYSATLPTSMVYLTEETFESYRGYTGRCADIRPATWEGELKPGIIELIIGREDVGPEGQERCMETEWVFSCDKQFANSLYGNVKEARDGDVVERHAYLGGFVEAAIMSTLYAKPGTNWP